MMKSTVIGTTLSLLVSSAAFALPATHSTQQPGLDSSNVVKIGKGDHDRHWKGKRAFRDDDFRYRGWKRRYSYRPYDWEDRGCVSIGPFWYCS
jgi:hypothetical protein